MKLLRDIEQRIPRQWPRKREFSDSSSRGIPSSCADFDRPRVPQQSLRRSIEGVFGKRRAHQDGFIDPVRGRGQSESVSTCSSSTRRIASTSGPHQASGPLNAKFREITETLFGADELKTQLDWIQAESRHQILFVDALQAVRPSDLPTDDLRPRRG